MQEARAWSDQVSEEPSVSFDELLMEACLHDLARVWARLATRAFLRRERELELTEHDFYEDYSVE